MFGQILESKIFRGFYSLIKERLFLFSFLSILLSYYLFNIIFICKYAVNDDIIMMMISSGYYTGSPDEHLIFINVIIGFVLKLFYIIYPHFNWYTLFLTLVNIVSCTVILYTFLLISRKLTGFLLFLIVYIFILKDFVFYIQFTQTATLAALSGTILLIYINNFQYTLLRLITGCLLLILASLIRFDSAFLVFAIASPFFVWNIIHKYNPRILLSMLISIVIMLICLKLNNDYYKKDKEWNYYQRVVKNMGKILNDPVFIYANINHPQFSEIGWTPNDYKIFFNNWILEDSTTFSANKLETLENSKSIKSKIFESGRKNIESWLNMQKTTLKYIYSNFFFQRPKHRLIKLTKNITYFINSYSNNFILLTAIILIGLISDKRILRYYLLSISIMFICILYFNLNNFILIKPRVLNSLMLSVLLLGMIHEVIIEVDFSMSQRNHYFSTVFLLILALITSIYLYSSSSINRENILYQDELSKYFQRNLQNTNILYYNGSKGFSTNNIKIFSTDYTKENKLKYYYNAWLCQSPINRSVFKNLNSSDFFDALLNGKLLILNESSDLNEFRSLIIFFKEHLNINVIVVSVDPREIIYRLKKE